MQDPRKNNRILRLLAAVTTTAVATLVFHTSTLAQDKTTIKVGVTPGEHAQIMEEVKKVAAKDGLTVNIVEFSDYIQPNAALVAGDIDANSFQHLPYLDAQIKDRGYKLVSIGTTIISPMGVYSKKVKSIDDLKMGAQVGIPNDPTNGGRALLLFETQGLIKLKPGAGLAATPLDIIDNPKKLKFVALDAAQLPRAINDLDVAVINGNYANAAGLNPLEDSIARESSENPYANVIVVRMEDEHKPWVAALLKAYHNDDIRKYILDTFNGAEIPAW